MIGEALPSYLPEKHVNEINGWWVEKEASSWGVQRYSKKRHRNGIYILIFALFSPTQENIINILKKESINVFAVDPNFLGKFIVYIAYRSGVYFDRAFCESLFSCPRFVFIVGIIGELA